jgi:hypothetical protein
MVSPLVIGQFALDAVAYFGTSAEAPGIKTNGIKDRAKHHSYQHHNDASFQPVHLTPSVTD